MPDGTGSRRSGSERVPFLHGLDLGFVALAELKGTTHCLGNRGLVTVGYIRMVIGSALSTGVMVEPVHGCEVNWRGQSATELRG